MLLNKHAGSQKRLMEPEALGALRGNSFNHTMDRCFPRKRLMTSVQRTAFTDLIFQRPLSSDILIDTTETTTDQGSPSGTPIKKELSHPLLHLVRAGALSPDGTFSCLLAEWQYFRQALLESSSSGTG